LKYFSINFKFFSLIIIQKPTPQLKVLIISSSVILNFFIQLKIFNVFILFRSISADNPFGMTLEILSFNPPPVIFALLNLY